MYKQILEDFNAPVDTKRPVKKRPKGKFGTVNPQLNEPHSTKSISGFKGQPGGKMKTVYMAIPSDEEIELIGTCQDDNVIEYIFGGADEFAAQVELNGDEFTHNDIDVKYDPEEDVHYFYVAK